MEAMLFRNPSVAIMASIQRHNFMIKCNSREVVRLSPDRATRLQSLKVVKITCRSANQSLAAAPGVLTF